jgi:hypothetical protein
MKLSTVVTALVLLAIPALAGAHVGNADPNVVHACVGNASKIVRIVGVNGVCISSPLWLAETPAHWPQQAAAGPQGPKGDQGDQGIQGIQGPPGASSAAAPAVRVTNTVAQVPAAVSALVVMTWDKELFDTADLHSATDNPTRLTAPIDGIYQVNVSVQWVSSNVNVGLLNLWLFKNGTENYVEDGILYSRIVAMTRVNAPLHNSSTLRVSTLLKLSAGDYLEVGTAAFTSDAYAIVTEYQSSNSNEFSMVWVAHP